MSSNNMVPVPYYWLTWPINQSDLKKICRICFPKVLRYVFLEHVLTPSLYQC